jgi:hypothetical protein
MMENITRERHSYPLWVANDIYEEIKEVRHAERKDTIKEAAEEIVMLGLAVKRGEYVKRAKNSTRNPSV